MTTELKNILLPEKVRELLSKEAESIEEQTPQERGRFLPDPVGYKMLIILPEQDVKYESGILKADTTRYADEVASVVGFVAKMGPDCYKDSVKFPTGPWCKVGDFVLMRSYTGSRFNVHGKEMRIINDDGIEGVVDDPRGIKRVGG